MVRDATELGRLRHDLKNVVTALRSGCMLVGKRVDPADRDAREILDEMRAELDKASALLDRLRPDSA